MDKPGTPADHPRPAATTLHEALRNHPAATPTTRRGGSRLSVDEPRTRAAAAAGRWATEVRAGFDFVRRTAVLRQVLLACSAGWSVIGIAEVVVYPVVSSLHRPVAFLGILVSVQGVGAIAGAPIAPWAMRRLGEGRVTAIGLVVCAAGVAGWSVPRLAVVCVAAGVFGAGMTWLAIGTSTLIQRRTPKDRVGRVDSFADLAVSAPNVAFVALGSVLVSLVDFRLLLLGMAAVMVTSGTWLISRREQRHRPDTAVGQSRAETKAPTEDDTITAVLPCAPDGPRIPASRAPAT